MQISRLIEIVFILLKKSGVTASELAQRFEVSPRTIYRDIETLCQSGIPIYTSKGHGGGIYIDESYKLSGALLSEQEQNELMLALGSQQITNNIACDKIIEKLSGVFKREVEDYIEVDFTDWRNNKTQVEIFKVIKQGILQKQKILIEYINVSETQIRKLQPLKLIFKHLSWYVYGFCENRQDFRLFKLSRIKSVNIIQENFQRKMPDRDVVWKTTWDEPLLTDVEIEFDASTRYRVYDEFDQSGLSEQGDKIVFIGKLPDSDYMLGFLMTYGSLAKVIQPQSWVEELKKRVQEIANVYK